MVGLLPETNATAETDVLLDAWDDFKGRWGAAAAMIQQVAELNERLTALGVVVSLVTGTMHLGNAMSANVVTNFMVMLLCLLVGFVADSCFLGRYLTIAIFTTVQASGQRREPAVAEGTSPKLPTGKRGPTGCVADLNGACPADLRVTSGTGVAVACKSACLAFGSPQYCCTGAYRTPDACKPTAYSQFFKNACPRAFSYAYDGATSTFTCAAGGDIVVSVR